jgi:hypothetical protein
MNRLVRPPRWGYTKFEIHRCPERIITQLTRALDRARST